MAQAGTGGASRFIHPITFSGAVGLIKDSD